MCTTKTNTDWDQIWFTQGKSVNVGGMFEYFRNLYNMDANGFNNLINLDNCVPV